MDTVNIKKEQIKQDFIENLKIVLQYGTYYGKGSEMLLEQLQNALQYVKFGWKCELKTNMVSEFLKIVIAG